MNKVRIFKLGSKQRLAAVTALLCLYIPTSAHAAGWNSFQLTGGIANLGRIAALSRSPNTMELLWVGPDGSVQDRNFYDGGTWNAFTLAQPGSASITGGIAAVSRSSGTMEVFWIGPDGSVQDMNYYSGIGWRGFTLAPAGSACAACGITAVSRSFDTMEVFFVAPDGSVQDKNYYDGSGWNGFPLAGAGSASTSTTSGITVVSRSFNTMELFYVGADNSVQDKNYYDGSGWNGFPLAGAGSASGTGGIAALARDANDMEVFWVGPNGQVEDANWCTSCKVWRQFPLAAAGLASPYSALAAVSRSTNTMEVFWVGADGHVQDANFYPERGWSQYALTQPGHASPFGGLAAVSRTATSMEMWFTGFTLGLGAGGSVPVVDENWYSPGWTDHYPRLAPFGTADYPWLVLECTLSDDRTVPEHLDDLINTFLTPQGAGTGNISDYYSDISYGAISFAGTSVSGWYAAPFNGSEPGLAGPNNRSKRVQSCANAIPAAASSKINFGSYWGIIMVTNHQNDGGACYTGQGPLQIQGKTYSLACIVLDPASMYPAFAAHEVGHGLGLQHSYDSLDASLGKTCASNAAPGEYCDPFDIMSALITKQFDAINFPTGGPGVNVPNLLTLGGAVTGFAQSAPNRIIPQSRIAVVNSPFQQKIQLAALSHPNAQGALTIEIVGNDPTFVYTVEYRQPDGWDAGLPVSGIMIHQFSPGLIPYSYLQDQNGMYYLPYTRWVDPSSMLSVSVCSFDSAQGTATVSVGSPAFSSLCP